MNIQLREKVYKNGMVKNKNEIQNEDELRELLQEYLEDENKVNELLN